MALTTRLGATSVVLLHDGVVAKAVPSTACGPSRYRSPASGRKLGDRPGNFSAAFNGSCGAKVLHAGSLFLAVKQALVRLMTNGSFPR